MPTIPGVSRLAEAIGAFSRATAEGTVGSALGRSFWLLYEGAAAGDRNLVPARKGLR
jgi:hypothetical protein